MKNKMLIWLMALLSYSLIFITPLIASYLLFAKPVDASAGGAFFYMTLSTVALFFIVKLTSVSRKMPMGYGKVIISLLLITVLTMSAKAFFEIVGNNVDKLVYFVLIWYAGYVLSIIPKVVAIRLDLEYLTKIKILG